MSKKVVQTVELAVGLAVSLWELVIESRGEEIAPINDQERSDNELPRVDSVVGAVEEVMSKKVGEAVELAVGLAASLWELVFESRGEEIATINDHAGAVDELPRADSVGEALEEAMSKKVGEAIGLAVGRAVLFWELVIENRGE